MSGVGHQHQNYFMPTTRQTNRTHPDCHHLEANWKWQSDLLLVQPPSWMQCGRPVYSYAASTLQRQHSYRVACKHSNALQYSEVCSAAMYDVRCLIQKKSYTCLALCNTWTSSFCLLLFWILLQNNDEKRHCMNVWRAYDTPIAALLCSFTCLIQAESAFLQIYRSGRPDISIPDISILYTLMHFRSCLVRTINCPINCISRTFFDALSSADSRRPKGGCHHHMLSCEVSR